MNLRDGFCFDSFYVNESLSLEASNFELVQALQLFVSSSEDKQNILWGKPQSGKSHLLQACCAKVSAGKYSVSYIPLKTFKSYGVESLTGLSFSSLIAVDDIDEIIGDKAWEIALFNLINQARDNNQRLLMASLENPRKMDCILPDLASRLIWGGSYQLHALSDTDKPRALQLRAKQRGFDLPDNVINYLYRRYSRNFEALMKILDKLDQESLQKKAKITIPFVRNVLGEQSDI